MLEGETIEVSRGVPGTVGAITSGSVVAVSGALWGDSLPAASTAVTR